MFIITNIKIYYNILNLTNSKILRLILHAFHKIVNKKNYKNIYIF